MNQFNGIGRLVADPELRYTPSGVAVCRFRIAINRLVRNEDQQQADYINCIAWRKQAENVANYMRKGSQIGITGPIQTGSYDGQDGRKVYTWEINCNNVQFLDSKPQEGSNSQGNINYHQPQQNSSQGQYGANNYQSSNSDPFANSGNVDVTEDDLPF